MPYAAGGGTDLVARIVAQKLQEKWGQPVVVENRAGAGGNLGAEAVFTAAPDGYTLLFTAQGPLVVNKSLYGKLTYDPDDVHAGVAGGGGLQRAAGESEGRRPTTCRT